MGGCVSSRHNNNNNRRKSTVVKESPVKRSLRFDTSRRIDDWIQPQGVFDRSSSRRRDAKDNKFTESEIMLSSSDRYYYDHQVEKIPELADHDQELRSGASSAALKPPDLEIDLKVVEPKKLDRWNSLDSRVRLTEFEKLSSKRLSDHHHHQIDKEQALVPRELTKNLSVSPVPKDTELKQISAGWPTWLVSVAGEALVDWAPRRASTFEKLEKIGQGTYSSVYRARDLIHNNKIVALKKVRFDLNDMESVKFMAREIIVMRRLDHPNVLKLQGLITAPLSSSLYLVFDYMDHDLLGLSSLPGLNFTEPQVKCYMRQLLSGLEHCHSRGVLHRDIKGSNLLIDGNGVLKIADFGLATFFDKDKTVPLTSHVVTLWYRPPELLLGASRYGVGVDLWSTGCILGELYAGKPILPGKTEVEQLHKIFKLCGSPTEGYWRKHELPPSSAGFRSAVPYRRKLSETYKEFPESVLLLLETLLSVDPDHRSSASSALESEYFKTKPFACDPSCLPKYPPSKEIDAKLRDEEKRQRPEKQERQDSLGRRSHERKAIPPPIRANHSLSMSMDRPYLDLKSRNESFKSFKEERTSHVPPVPDYPNMQTRNNQSNERVSYSGPLMSNGKMGKSTMYVKENAPPPRYPPSRVNPRVLSGSVSSKALLDQPVTNQRRRDRRAYNRADTMDSRHMTIPIDPSWYDPSDSKIYTSGRPLLEQPSRVDQMLEEHDRQIQEFNRQTQKAREGKTGT